MTIELTTEVRERRRLPIPQEVKEIMKQAARYEYALLSKAGWCKDCKREKTNGGSYCAVCNEKRRVAATKINRRKGHKSWEQRRAEKAVNMTGCAHI